jgi:hypothetical protein
MLGEISNAFSSRSYKELMVQCNHLGRSETHAKQKIEKASELIKKLRVCSTQLTSFPESMYIFTLSIDLCK